jgi:hypothetical protein
MAARSSAKANALASATAPVTNALRSIVPLLQKNDWKSTYLYAVGTENRKRRFVAAVGKKSPAGAGLLH